MRPIFEGVLPCGIGGMRGSSGSHNRMEKRSINKSASRVISPGSGVIHKGYMRSVTSDDGLDRLNTNAGYALETTGSIGKEADLGIELDSRNISVTRGWDVERQ